MLLFQCFIKCFSFMVLGKGMSTYNCVDQNKNIFVMYYLMWRVMASLDNELSKATITFFPVGHTKFAPDWCFGLIRQCFRRIKIIELDDTANCANLSSAVSVPQLVGSLDGTVFLPMYNWNELFDDHHDEESSQRNFLVAPIPVFSS